MVLQVVAFLASYCVHSTGFDMICPSYLPPYSTVFWHYKQWRTDGVLDRIMATLHAKVRQQVKKKQVDKVINYRLASREEYVQCQC